MHLINCEFLRHCRNIITYHYRFKNLNVNIFEYEIFESSRIKMYKH